MELKDEKQARSFESIEFVDRGINSFKRVYIPDNCSSIDLSKNNLSDLSELRSLPYLRLLNLDDNCIRSFKKIHYQPSLKWISLKHNPITQNKHFKLACLIVYGSQLASINQEIVSDMQREKADLYRDKAKQALFDGFLISSLNPLRFVNIYKRKRRLSSLSSKPSFAITSKRIIDNEYKPSKNSIKRFATVVSQIRNNHTYGIPRNIHRKRREKFKPKLPDFIQDDDSVSFEGEELQKVILPQNMKLSSDSYTYSEAVSSSSYSSSSTSDESDETINSDDEATTTT